jgi:hypothetical protein
MQLISKVWDLFVERDALRPLCSHAPASPSYQTGQLDKILEMARSTFNWDAPVEERYSDPE